MHQYIVRKHEAKSYEEDCERIIIIRISETLEDAKKFVNQKIYRFNIEFCESHKGEKIEWTTSDEKDLVLYSNKVQGVVYSITGFDTNTEYEDL